MFCRPWRSFVWLSLALAAPAAWAQPEDHLECGFHELEAALEVGALALSQGMNESLHRDMSQLLDAASIRAEELGASDLVPECRLRLAEFYHRLGQGAQSLGRMTDAETWLQRSLDLYRSEMGESVPVLGDILDDLSEVYYRTGRSDVGFSLREQAYELRRATLREDDPRVAKSLMDLGAAYQLRGELGLSEQYYRQGIAILEKVGGEHPQQLGEALLVLANLVEKAGRIEEAKALTARGLKLLDG